VEVVNDGAEAVQRIIAATAPVDIILMDCEMPVMDGYRATLEIRRHERTIGSAPLPIVALTAHALPEYQQRSRDAGMNDHLNKPINLAALSTLLERYLKTDDAKDSAKDHTKDKAKLN
jgi:CheY-like chemotaxis protein